LIIYKIQNKINGKIYIGQTIRTLKKRINGHLNQTRCYRIHRALLKYDIDNFDISILATAKTIEELNILEEKYIEEYNSLSPNGYNLTTGGKNRTPSEEAKRKMSESRKGYKLTEEAKRKISDFRKGRKLTEETRRKISESLRGEKHYLYGKRLSEEHKRNLSESLRGHKATEETRRRMSESRRGENHPRAKLTENQVREIKQLLLTSILQKEIAKRFKVSRGCIGGIAQNIKWKHIK